MITSLTVKKNGWKDVYKRQGDDREDLQLIFLVRRGQLHGAVLLKIRFVPVFDQLVEHASVFHPVTVYDRVEILERVFAAIVDKQRALPVVLPVEHAVQVILVVLSLHHRIVDGSRTRVSHFKPSLLFSFRRGISTDQSGYIFGICTGRFALYLR